MFSLDIFGNGYSIWETVVGLFMHNIPVFILAIILAISWRHEVVGGVGFILAGLLYLALTLVRAFNNPFEFYELSYSLIIAGPAFFIGILFLVGWRRKLSKKH